MSLSNEIPTLTIGRHRLLEKLPSAALPDWFEAIDQTTNAARWLYAIAEWKLKEPKFQLHPPSLKLARLHATVKGTGLQSLSPPALIDGYLVIAATPAEGKPLREFLRKLPRRTMAAEKATAMVTKIAGALATLHQLKIVHGRIGIDQVWWDGQDEVTLLRDPVFPPVSPLGPIMSSAIGVEDDREYRIRYAAPEFTAPSQLPTTASDVYALGCLWLELMTGQSPYAETKLEQVPNAACKIPLTIPSEIELTSNQRKCLEFMLAKNPNSRFSDASKLSTTFDTVLLIDARKPQVAPQVVPQVVARAAASTVAKPPPEVPNKPTAVVKEPPPSYAVSQREPSSSPPDRAPPIIEAIEQVPAPKIVEVAPTAIQEPPAMVASSEKRPTGSIAKNASDKKIVGSSKTAPSNTRRVGKKKARPKWFIPAMIGSCIAVLGGLIGLLTWSGGESSATRSVAIEKKANIDNLPTPASTRIEGPATAASGSRVRVVDPLEDQFTLAKNDDTLPWIPPRASQPYSLAMLPPGAQGFIFVRPKAWLTTSAGQAVIQSLAAPIDTLWKPIENACGIPLTSIQELAIGLYGGRSDGWPVLVYRLQLAEKTSIDQLKQRLPNASTQAVGDKRTILMVGDQAIYLSPDDQASESKNQLLAFGPSTLIRELIDMEDGAPLRRQMETLWQASDAQSDLSMLISTGFFFSDARSVLPSISPRVQSLCKELLDEKTQAILVTTSIEPQWYGELRAVGATGDDATRFTQQLQTRMKSIANVMEAELVASPASPYWRALAARFPQMLRSLARYQRFGIENAQAISNFYLPTEASANLAIATWMSLQMPSVVVTSSPTQVASSSTAKKLAGDELLAHAVSINFEQEPLDSALALITEEVNRSLPAGSIPIALSIDGKSFELASVTRNQQIRDFRFKDQPLRGLLTDLAARVNPDRTVKSLGEDKQAVIWVLVEEAGKSNIIFTTRRGIEGSDRKLPQEFSKTETP